VLGSRRRPTLGYVLAGHFGCLRKPLSIDQSVTLTGGCVRLTVIFHGARPRPMFGGGGVCAWFFVFGGMMDACGGRVKQATRQGPQSTSKFDLSTSNAAPKLLPGCSQPPRLLPTAPRLLIVSPNCMSSCMVPVVLRALCAHRRQQAANRMAGTSSSWRGARCRCKHGMGV
jgi:hypothetical protein